MDAALICTAHWHRRRRKILGYATRQSATHGSLIADAERDFLAPRIAASFGSPAKLLLDASVNLHSHP